ncbi:hypothetical protein ACN267_30230 [Micromonospora sp. WMMD734]|uniref:hypothetical protein n=1 Tax=Micromonospora sp. WMMD734 TaxID=3404129 RepID=UPI003B95DE7C
MTVVDGPTVVLDRTAGPTDDPTALIAAVPPPVPVFVDPSGRRHSRLRWLAYALGAVVLIYSGLVGVSFAGGIAPHSVLPFVDEVAQPERSAPPTRTATTIPAAPTPTTGVVAPTVAPRSPRGSGPAVAPVTPSATGGSASTSPSPSASRSPSRSPATATASPRPTRSTPPATTPNPPTPTDEPPVLPDPLPGDAEGVRVDG